MSSRKAFDSCSACHGFVESWMNRPGPLISGVGAEGDSEAGDEGGSEAGIGVPEKITCESKVPSCMMEEEVTD